MKKFDYLEVDGDYTDLGRAIGTKFKDAIQASVARRTKMIPNYDSYLRKTEPYFLATREAFPNLIRELEATAHAAGVGVADLFAINNREVSRSWPNQNLVSRRDNGDHCTVAVSFGDSGAVVGHNEDWDGATPEALYFLKAKIGGTSFMGLQYKKIIPGVAVTMNNWGLVQCINELNPTSQIGVPKNFIAPAVFECKTLDEAENLIRNTKRASGYNHVLIQGNEVRNIETAGDKIGVEKVIGGTYVHTNHYLTPELIPLEKFHTQSSESRYERAMKIILPGMNVAEMESLLSDKTNKEFPISREDATLGSVVALPKENKMYICHGPSVKGQYEEYV